MKLSDITLAYGKKVIASNINAELLPGELVCLVGRNGAGKSTLIRHILKTAGYNDFGNDINAEVARKISVVLTDHIDVEGMTVRDIVALGRSPYTGFFGILSPEDEKIIDNSLSLLSLHTGEGMKEIKNRQVNTLSDGERQKVMIAKAIAQQTPYIILDEPTAFLDYPSKKETMQLLRKLTKESFIDSTGSKTKRAILISTHDLDIALKYCDKVWLMANNTLKEISPQEFSLDSF